MNGEFTPQARKRWESIPAQFQDKLLHNVWCTRCRTATTIVGFKGMIIEGDLVLKGLCIRCGGKVARVIERE